MKSKTKLRYFLGLINRYRQYCRFQHWVSRAKNNGAAIGEGVVISRALSLSSNKNLVIGSHTSIGSSYLDLRSPVRIGSHCIIGGGNTILTTSHDVDSPDFLLKNYGIVIEDYVWISSNCLILPSCRKIGYGAVIGAGSVVVRDVPAMTVMSGNPAREIRKRACTHSGLVVESLLGGDYLEYKKARNI